MIQFEQVWKTYSKELFMPQKPAVRGVSFSLEGGKTLGLIGANGAGKSTTIRLLMDFIRPDKGTIRIFDQYPSGYQLRKRIGYLPETASFPANLTVMDLLRFTGATCNMSRSVLSERAENWLNALDLWEARHRPLRGYSKGMQQRANFVLALVNDPDLLILDEPMSGLDPIGRGKIIELILQLKSIGKTILFCSHILGDVDRLVDDILVLHKGKKVFHGSPAELMDKQGSESLERAYLSLVNTCADND